MKRIGGDNTLLVRVFCFVSTFVYLSSSLNLHPPGSKLQAPTSHLLVTRLQATGYRFGRYPTLNLYQMPSLPNPRTFYKSKLALIVLVTFSNPRSFHCTTSTLACI